MVYGARLLGYGLAMYGSSHTWLGPLTLSHGTTLEAALIPSVMVDHVGHWRNSTEWGQSELGRPKVIKINSLANLFTMNF